MYNSDIKSKFIHEYTQNANSIVNCVRFFNSIEKYEILFSSDICRMDCSQLKTTCENISCGRLSSISTKMSILRSYLKWCNENSIGGNNIGFIPCDIDRSGYMKKHMVSNNVHLSIVMDEIFDDIDFDTIDIIFRCYLWMAFIGIDMNVSTSIKRKDIDFNIMKMYVGNSSYDMYKESIICFKKASDLESFNYLNSNYNKIIKKSRAQGDCILRGTKSNSTPLYLRTELSRKVSEANASKRTRSNINYKSIKTSGMFYNMFLLESSGVEEWFDIVCRKYKDDIYRTNATMEDYKMWKLAFYK